ncbi:MAG: hypothetical protein H7X99_01705 [Saprospiraceae bacterium]|nr:hypothetical protein [Saprospiraceae bacterium]
MNVIFFIMAGFMFSCGNKEIKEMPLFVADKVTPAPFPDTGIPDFTFPQDSNTINGWIKSGKMDEIYHHGWGIWAGLTSSTTQSLGGQVLLVYETWLTPSEIIDSINGTGIHRTGRANLNKPNQFLHAELKGGEHADTKISESVSYSPAASDYALKNKIFMYTTLAHYAQEGRTQIPDFPSDAITIKPVFKLIEKSKLDSTGLYAMASWHGPTNKVEAFPEIEWKSCIYVDINNRGQGNGSQDMSCSGPSRATIYNLTDFISYTMNDEDVYYYNKEFGTDAKPGDIALLVGMHVATRETLRWTWQSFWWASDADNPPAPSSKQIAQARPLSYLKGAAAHYAMAVAYSMVYPDQPYTGGSSVGDTVIGFNPYLEAGFGPSVFTGSNSYVVKNGQKIMTNAGVRTNCMSCHVYAAYDVYQPSNGTPYNGDAYVSLDDSIFTGKLKLDFAWSVQGNIDTTGMAAFLSKQPGK